MRLSPAGKFWLAYFLGLAIVVVTAVKIFAAQGSFSWLPNHEEDLAGYRIYHGSASGQYDGHVDVHLPPRAMKASTATRSFSTLHRRRHQGCRQ